MVITLRPVLNGPDTQVVDALTYLLQEAKAGRINGLAYVTLEPGMDFQANVVGRPRRSPLLALGITAALKKAVEEFVEL